MLTPKNKTHSYVYSAIVWIALIIIIIALYNKYGYIAEYYLNRYIFYSTIKLPATHGGRNLLLYSNSTMSLTGDHLGYGRPSLKKFLADFGVKKVLCITYAWPNMRGGRNTGEGTTFFKESAQPAFQKIGLKAEMLDTEASVQDQIDQINAAEAYYMNGGNTFWLTESLHQSGVAQALRNKIFTGTPYIGASAGTNATCPTMQTTNDMPNVWPTTSNTLNIIPFQINVHYNDFDVGHGFGGESRELRLNEYLEANPYMDVLALREGSMLHVSGNNAETLGMQSRKSIHYTLSESGDLIKKIIPVGSNVSFLLQ